MNLPEKAFEPLLDRETLSFFLNAKYKSEDDLVHIILPKWFLNLLKDKLDEAREEGRKEIRDSLNNLLGR